MYVFKFSNKIFKKIGIFFKTKQNWEKKKKNSPFSLSAFFFKGQKKKSHIYISGFIHACFFAFFGFLLFFNPLFSSCLFFLVWVGGGRVGAGPCFLSFLHVHSNLA